MSTLFRTRATFLSPQGYAAVFKRAFDPRVELDRHRQALLSAVRTRQLELGNPRSPRLAFAADTLLDFRVRGAKRHLKLFDVVPDAFAGFLRYSADVARESLESDATADELAESLSASLDSLHAYLLTHDLVAPGYVESEARLAQSLIEGPTDDEPERTREAGDDATRADAPTSAANDNLALAA